MIYVRKMSTIVCCDSVYAFRLKLVKMFAKIHLITYQFNRIFGELVVLFQIPQSLFNFIQFGSGQENSSPSIVSFRIGHAIVMRSFYLSKNNLSLSHQYTSKSMIYILTDWNLFQRVHKIVKFQDLSKYTNSVTLSNIL